MDEYGTEEISAPKQDHVLLKTFTETTRDDIDVGKLAEELGVREYHLPEQTSEEIVGVLKQVFELVDDWGDLQGIQLGVKLAESESKILSFFDSLSCSWRLLFYITHDIIDAVQGDDARGEQKMLHVMNCWRFYAYKTAQKKDCDFYDNFNYKEPIGAVKFAHADVDRMIRGVWGNRQKNFMSTVGFGDMVRADEAQFSIITKRFFDSFPGNIVGGESAFTRSRLVYLKRKDLPMEIIHIRSRASDQDMKLRLTPFNIFLCQRQGVFHDDMLRSSTIELSRGADDMELWGCWVERYIDELVDQESEVRKMFYHTFQIEGELFEKGAIAAHNVRDKKPEIIHLSGIEKTRALKGIPRQLCEVLEKRYSARITRLEIDRVKRVAALALDGGQPVIETPPMNFIIDTKTGVVIRPEGWKIPDGCSLEWNFWYMEDGHKKPLSPSEDHFAQKSLNDVVFSDEGGRKFYGKICFSATLTVPQGSTFSSGTSSISSSELSFTKVRLLEVPLMDFKIDESNGVVKVPDDWVLPDGCKITWKACYKGNKGKELVQATGFQINNGILNISYQEGGKEVYGKLYVTVTLIAPQGSTFSSGASLISSSELSFFRKAPEVQTTKPDAPQNIIATSAGFGEVIVTFDPPASNGGSPIMSYTVTANNGQQVTGTRSPIRVMGLPGGKLYTFTVTATNHKGESNPSSASIPTVATLKCATLADTQEYWTMALEDSNDSLSYEIDKDSNLIITLDHSLTSELHNPLYKKVIVSPDNRVDIGDSLGKDNHQLLITYVQSVRQKIKDAIRKQEQQREEEEIRLQEQAALAEYQRESREMNDAFGPAFDILSAHTFQSFADKSVGIDALRSLTIPGGKMQYGILPVGTVCQLDYSGIQLQYIIGTKSTLSSVIVKPTTKTLLTPGQLAGLRPLMDIFAKTVFFYTHADEKYRKKVLNEQGEHKKLETTYFNGLAAGERKRVIRMYPHLARQASGEYIDFPQEEDAGVVSEVSSDSLKSPNWNKPDEEGKLTYYLLRLSSVSFNGVDESEQAKERRAKLRTSPFAQTIIMDRIKITLERGGKRDPIKPTASKGVSAGHALKELIVQDKYRLLSPDQKLAHPDLMSDYLDLLDKYSISVSFTPALVRLYNASFHTTAG